MPKIALHSQELGIKDVPLGPQQDENITPKIADTSALGEAIYKTGAAASDFANTLLRSKVLADTAAAKSEFASAMTEHLAAGKQMTDFDAIEKHKLVADEIRAGVKAKYPLAAGLDPYMNHSVRVANVDLDNHAVKLVVDDIKAKNLAEVARLNKEIAFADPDQAEEFRIERDAFLDNIAEVGAEHKSTVETWKREGDIKSELYKYEELIRTDAPGAKQMLLERNEDGTPKNVKYLTPDLYGKLINEADQRDRFNKNEFFTNQHRKQDENRQSLWSMIDQGKPDAEVIVSVDRAMQQDPVTGMIGLPAHEGFDLKEKIRNGTLKHQKTDYDVWDNLYTRIQNGENVQADIGRAVSRGTVSIQDAKALRSLIEKETNGLDKQAQYDLDQTLKNFHEDLKAIKGEFGGTSSEQNQAVSALLADATRVSMFVRSGKDIPWLREYLDKSKEVAEKNMSSSYREALSKRNNEWYDKHFGDQGFKRREGKINAPATSTSGNPSQYDSIIDQVFGKDAPTAKAIARAENAPMDPTKVNPAGGGVGAIGLFQIRGKLHEQALKDAGIIKSTEDLKIPEVNIRAAKFLYDRDGWTPWNESRPNWEKSGRSTTGTVSTGGKYRRIS